MLTKWANWWAEKVHQYFVHFVCVSHFVFYILRLLKIPVVKARLFILFLFSINLRIHDSLYLSVIFQIPA